MSRDPFVPTPYPGVGGHLILRVLRPIRISLLALIVAGTPGTRVTSPGAQAQPGQIKTGPLGDLGDLDDMELPGDDDPLPIGAGSSHPTGDSDLELPEIDTDGPTGLDEITTPGSTSGSAPAEGSRPRPRKPMARIRTTPDSGGGGGEGSGEAAGRGGGRHDTPGTQPRVRGTVESPQYKHAPHERREPRRKQFESAVNCAQCHDEIYDQWQLSMHAQACSNPVFKAAYACAKNDLGREAEDLCLSCHAPAAVISGDFAMRAPSSREGVTCDVCHSMTAVSPKLTTPLHFFTNPGVQLGPNPGSEAPHPTAFSPLQTQSLHCAGCHRGRLHATDGFMAYDSYGEWAKSPYNRLVGDTRHTYARPERITTCQDCHMRARPGRSAKEGPYRTEVHGHFMPGGNSPTMIGTAVTFYMTVRRAADRQSVRVTTQVQNRAGGHLVPTGYPDRRLVVEITGYDSSERILFQDRRTYGKILRDSRGNTPARFWQAAGVAVDNRVAPGEIRTETFRFGIDTYQGQAIAHIRGRLLYYPFDQAFSRIYGMEPIPIVVEDRDERFSY